MRIAILICGLALAFATYASLARAEAPSGRKEAGSAPVVRSYDVDAMRVQDGKITEHWGVANLVSVLQQLDAWPRAAGDKA